MAESFAKKLYESSEKGEPEEHEVLLAEVINFISRIITEKNVREIARGTSNTLTRLFGITETIISIWDEEAKKFRVYSAHGFPLNIEKEILDMEFTIDWIFHDVPREFKVEEDVLYFSAEKILNYGKKDKPNPTISELIRDKEDILIDHPEDTHVPRKSKDYWHELDFFEFIIRDSNGKAIGYLETNDSLDERLPSKETLLLISIFVKIAGLAFESQRTRDELKEASAKIDGLVSLMTRDLRGLLESSVKAVNVALKPNVEDIVIGQSIDAIDSAVSNSMEIIDRVAWLRELESRPHLLRVKTDAMTYIRRGIDEVRRQHPSLKVNVKSDKRIVSAICDPLLVEAVTSTLETLIAVKENAEEPMDISLYEEEFEDSGDNFLIIAFSSADIEANAWRKLKTDISLVYKDLKRFTLSRDLFAKYAIVLIARRYGGKVNVDEALSLMGDKKRGALRIAIPLQ